MARKLSRPEPWQAERTGGIDLEKALEKLEQVAGYGSRAPDALWQLYEWQFYGYSESPEQIGRFFTPEQLQQLIRPWWTLIEFPGNLGTGRMVDLFQAAGFVSDQDDVTAPTEVLTVYRGVQGYGSPRGLSWTTDLDKAVWFARRWPYLPLGTVWAAEVPPKHVLGMFHGREEAEVVVNPRGLRNLRAVAMPE